MLHIPVLVQQRQEEDESESMRTSVKGRKKKGEDGREGGGRKGEREGWASLSGDPKRLTGPCGWEDDPSNCAAETEQVVHPGTSY